MNQNMQYNGNCEFMIETNIYDKHIRSSKSQKKEMTFSQREKVMNSRQKQRQSKMIFKKHATNRERKEFENNKISI